MEIIKVRHLCKTFRVRCRKEEDGFWNNMVHRKYEQRKAVDDISFSVSKGEMIGYLGPNGAGKSTTIKMLTGILVPSSGQILSNGLDPYRSRREYVRHIGVVFGQRSQLWWDIPVYESLDLLKYMYQIPEDEFKKNLELFYDILGIGEFAMTPVRQLSLGQRMRADLCASLLHNPDIVFLDEPTIGLDAIVKKNVREFIRTINQQRQTTVMLTTHDMADIEKLCSRVIVIDHGKAIYDGSLENVKETFGSRERMEVAMAEIPADLSWFYQAGGESAEFTPTGLILTYDHRRLSSTAILTKLMQCGTIQNFRVFETEIEDAIRAMYLTAPQDQDTAERG